LKSLKDKVKVIIDGAPLTEKFAKEIGADACGKRGNLLTSQYPVKPLNKILENINKFFRAKFTTPCREVL